MFRFWGVETSLLTNANQTHMPHTESALTKACTVDCGIPLVSRSRPQTLSALLNTNELFTSFHLSSAADLVTSFYAWLIINNRQRFEASVLAEDNSLNGAVQYGSGHEVKNTLCSWCLDTFLTFVFTFEEVVRGAESWLCIWRHCWAWRVMSRRWLVYGWSRHVLLLPIGQHLSAEAQGWQDKGVGAPSFHFLHAQGGTETGPLWGGHGYPDGLGLVSSDHARRRGHAAGGHQELTAFPAHGWSWFVRKAVEVDSSVCFFDRMW